MPPARARHFTGGALNKEQDIVMSTNSSPPTRRMFSRSQLRAVRSECEPGQVGFKSWGLLACNLLSKADREGQRPRRALGAVAPLNSSIEAVDQRLNDLKAARRANLRRRGAVVGDTAFHEIR